MVKKSLIILGAGEQGRVVANICSLMNYQKISFLDDNSQCDETIGKLKDLSKFSNQEHDFIVAFGNDQLRKKWFNRAKNLGIDLINAIHPHAVIESEVKLGQNVMIGGLTYVNIKAVIGDNAIINNGCVIEHDNKIGAHCQLGPGVVTGGGVLIEPDVFVGMGAVIRDHVSVVAKSKVGAGAVVIADISQPGLYLGVPAKRKSSSVQIR